MIRNCLLSATAWLILVSASPPAAPDAPGPRAAPGTYEPCSATVRDKCAQRYEPESTAVLGADRAGEIDSRAAAPRSAGADAPPVAVAEAGHGPKRRHRSTHQARSIARAGERG